MSSCSVMFPCRISCLIPLHLYCMSSVSSVSSVILHVVGCVMQANKRSQCLGVRFFRIPTKSRKNLLRRTLWINAIIRKNWKPATWERVCSRHFHPGKPSNDENSLDYRPTRFMKRDQLMLMCKRRWFFRLLKMRAIKVSL